MDPAAVVVAVLVASVPGVLSFIATMRKESRSDARAQAENVAGRFATLEGQIADCERRREESREKYYEDRLKLSEKVAELRGELRAFEKFIGVWRPRKRSAAGDPPREE